MGLIPAVFKGIASFIGGRKNARTANASNQYVVDQKRRDYEAQQLAEQEQDQRKLDGIDFLESVAQGKGYSIPPGAFEALKRRGAYRGPDSRTRILDAPKESYGISDALGAAANTYADSVANAERNSSYFHGADGGVGIPSFDGAAGGDDVDILEYYQSLLPPGDEVSYRPGVTTTGRR